MDEAVETERPTLFLWSPTRLDELTRLASDAGWRVSGARALAGACARGGARVAMVDARDAPEEALDNQALIREQYRGIRPAPGYPACPDHTEKGPLFRWLGATDAIGLHLTESFAMTPTAAVSGYYLSHPQARYFGVGKVGRDQVEDYARRKGIAADEAERWLGANLAYVPGAPA